MNLDNIILDYLLVSFLKIGILMEHMILVFIKLLTIYMIIIYLEDQKALVFSHSSTSDTRVHLNQKLVNLDLMIL